MQKMADRGTKTPKLFKLQLAHLISEASKTIQLGLFNFRSFLNIGMSHQMFADNFDKTCESKLLTVIEEPDTK